MHINSSLYNAEIIHEPWPYTVIDDFFTKDTWEKLSQISKYILSDTPNEYLKNCIQKGKETTVGGKVFNIWELIQSGVPEDIVECYWDACEEILENRERIYSQFPYHKPDADSLMKPCLNLDFEGNWYEPHPDSDTKVISLICYLDPEESEGTALHTDETHDSMVERLDWKPNRCMVFCPSEHTWHSFRCQSKHRLVLAMFVERYIFNRPKRIRDRYTFSNGKVAEFWYDNG